MVGHYQSSIRLKFWFRLLSIEINIIGLIISDYLEPSRTSSSIKTGSQVSVQATTKCCKQMGPHSWCYFTPFQLNILQLTYFLKDPSELLQHYFGYLFMVRLKEIITLNKIFCRSFTTYFSSGSSSHFDGYQPIKAR